MTDYALTLKVRNAPMLEQMKLVNIFSVAELARESGLSATVLYPMINLEQPMYDKRGGIRESVVKLSEFLGCLPEDLYPEAHWVNPLAAHTFHATVDAETMLKISSSCNEDPMVLLEKAEESKRFQLITQKLKPREIEVIQMHVIDGETLEDVARVFDVSRERVRQILAQGLLKLTSGPMYDALREVAPDFYDGVVIGRKKQNKRSAERMVKAMEKKKPTRPYSISGHDSYNSVPEDDDVLDDIYKITGGIGLSDLQIELVRKKIANDKLMEDWWT